MKEKSFSFALNIISLYRCLISGNEIVISRQVLKSGTSIGTNVEEALAGQSRADFLSIDVNCLERGERDKLLVETAQGQQFMQ